MKTIKITQVRSKIHCPERQKRTIEALGIRKMHNPVVLTATPQILGMIKKVEHLLLIEDN
jgi:large subunit ribosomal protein L30